PLSGDAASARMRSKVDLPDPFGPMRPIRSFSSTVKLTPANRGRAPNDAVSCCASRRIAIARSLYDIGRGLPPTAGSGARRAVELLTAAAGDGAKRRALTLAPALPEHPF